MKTQEGLKIEQAHWRATTNKFSSMRVTKIRGQNIMLYIVIKYLYYTHRQYLRHKLKYFSIILPCLTNT